MLLALGFKGRKCLLTVKSGVVNPKVEMAWSTCVESTSCGWFQKRC